MSMSPWRILAALAAAAILAAGALAHTYITNSNIEDGAVLAEAPESFDFSFADAVSLIGMELETVSGDPLGLDFTRSPEMTRDFSVALPELSEGAYVLKWRAAARDGHIMRGEIAFEIDFAEGGHAHHAGASPGHARHDHGDAPAVSTPADGAVVDGPVEEITLRFNHPMTIRSVQLMTLAMERIALDFEPSQEPVSEQVIAVEALEAGDYELIWRAGDEDHQMSGTVRFTVRGG